MTRRDAWIRVRAAIAAQPTLISAYYRANDKVCAIGALLAPETLTALFEAETDDDGNDLNSNCVQSLWTIASVTADLRAFAPLDLDDFGDLQAVNDKVLANELRRDVVLAYVDEQIRSS